jgi:hypothetical protein
MSGKEREAEVATRREPRELWMFEKQQNQKTKHKQQNNCSPTKPPFKSNFAPLPVSAL